MEDEVLGFVVARLDRRGELPPSYLRSYALAGRNGLRQLAFGARSGAHLFDQRAVAEGIARRLRRRVSMTEYEVVVEEALPEAVSMPGEAVVP